MKSNNIQRAIMVTIVIVIAIFAEVLLLGSAYDAFVNMWRELTNYHYPRWGDALIDFIMTLIFLIIALCILLGLLQAKKKKPTAISE